MSGVEFHFVGAANKNQANPSENIYKIGGTNLLK